MHRHQNRFNKFGQKFSSRILQKKTFKSFTDLIFEGDAFFNKIGVILEQQVKSKS